MITKEEKTLSGFMLGFTHLKVNSYFYVFSNIVSKVHVKEYLFLCFLYKLLKYLRVKIIGLKTICNILFFNQLLSQSRFNFYNKMMVNFCIVNCVLTLLVFINSQQCEPGRYWREQSQQCTPCDWDCYQCSESGCLKYTDQENNDKQNMGTNIRLLDADCNAQCTNCNSSLCYQCQDGFAVIGGAGANRNCQRCEPTCLTCTIPTNDGTCSSCEVGRYLNGSNYCRPCSSDWSYCLECNSTRCLICNASYYQASGSTDCISCTAITFCVNCSSSGCTACQPYYQVVNNTCVEICGDFHIISYPCDNAKGIPYDGCDDTCAVMFDFTCNVTGTSNVCSFTGQLQITEISLTKSQFDNKLELVVDLFPPLYAFSNADLSQIFFINDTDLVIDSLHYQNGQLKVSISFLTTVVNRPFELLFDPTSSSDPRFSLSTSASFSTTIKTTFPAYYYSPINLQLSKLINYFTYAIVGLGWLIFLIGIFSRKLAGLELMFVYQFAWVSLLWLPDQYPLAYSMSQPLKYASGYGFPLAETNYYTELPFQANQFKVDSRYFSNNFNLALILYLVPLLGALISRLIACKQDYKQSAIQKYQFFLELSMYGVMVNIIGLTAYSLIFFYSESKIDIISLVIFSLSALVTLGIWIKFYIDPDPFKRFRYSFNIQCLAHYHYFLHLANLISIVLLTGLLPSLYWVCAIPLGLLALETILYRPYRQLSQSLRSFFYLVLMLLTGALRALFLINNNQWRMSDLSTFLLVGLMVGFILAAVWAYIEVLKDIFCRKQLQNLQKKKIQYTLFEDMKFMKEIGNPQRIMQMTGLNPIKSFNAAETARNSQAQSLTNEQNQQHKKIRQYQIDKLNNLSGKQLQEHSYGQNQPKIKVIIPKQNDMNKNNLNQDSGENINGEQNFQQYEEFDKNLLRKDIIAPPVEEVRPAFKLSQEKPLFKEIFSYLSDEIQDISQPKPYVVQPSPKMNEEQFEWIDEAKKMALRKVIKKEMNFVKIKNAEQLAKPKDQKLLEEYHAI